MFLFSNSSALKSVRYWFVLSVSLPFLFVINSSLRAQDASKDVMDIDKNHASDSKFYLLKYKRSGRTIKIEKPPISATSTPFIINGQTSLNRRKEIGPVDGDYLTASGDRPLDIRITNQTCEIGSILNTASFTICSNEKETITLIDANSFKHAIQDSRKAIHSIYPHSCETISVIGDDSDLQFDCSGIFGLTFQVVLTPSGQKSYFGVPIRVSTEKQ